MNIQNQYNLLKQYGNSVLFSWTDTIVIRQSKFTFAANRWDV